MLGKRDVLVYKGYAIVMMLFLHIFNNLHYLPKDDVFFLLTKFANLCVPIYVFLSGYGLSKSNNINLYSSFIRIRKFYFIFWPIFILFTLILYLNGYLSCNIREYILNFFCLADSYNHIWWFIPMYFCLLLTFPLLYKLKKYLLGVLIISFVLRLLGKYFLDHFTHENPLIFPDILFAILNSYCVYLVVFISGIYLSDSVIYNKYISLCKQYYLCRIVILFVIVVVSCFIPYLAAFSFILVPLLIPTFYNNIFFEKLGHLSTIIWLFHGAFLICYADYLYQIEQPLLLYSFFLILNLFWALFYNTIVNRIKKFSIYLLHKKTK